MKPISKDAEEALFREFQSGNKNSFTQIFNQFHPLAMSFVNRFVKTDCKHLKPDLESHVNLILWGAAKNFDVTKGHRFSTYLSQCVMNEICRNIKACRKENGYVNTNGEREVTVTDPCSDESILAELTPLCKSDKQRRLLEVICTDENIWYKNGNVNYTEIGRKLDTSGEAVRQMVFKLRSNRNLKSALCELVPR